MVRIPSMLLEPPSSRTYSPQKGRQRNMVNMERLWVTVMAIRFLFDRTVLSDPLKVVKWRVCSCDSWLAESIVLV